MASHPLAMLGFEPVASPAQIRPRTLADLGFETTTDTISARAETAGRKTARDPKLLPAIQQMLVHPQVVGAVEPGSGRKVVQPTDNPAVNQVLATEAMPAYRAQLLETIRHIPGARLAASRDAKNPRRLVEKITREGQPAETVSDYGAAQIAVASPQAKDAVVAAVKRHFHVLRQQDHFIFGDPEYGYRSFSLQVQMPNGFSEELQIVPEEVLEANRQEHHDYKKVRDAELVGRSAGKAKATARAINDAAMARFNLRNLLGSAGERVPKHAVVKGSEVRLPGGVVARVVYVDPNRQIARVRTEDGRKVTVRYKDLRVS